MKTQTQEEIDILMAGLRESVVNVTFTKKDGSERKMTCTLNQAFIPEDSLPKGTVEVTEAEDEPEYVRVYATDVQGWRSFRFDSVLNFGE